MADHNHIARELARLGRRKAKLIAKLDRTAQDECALLRELLEQHRDELDEDTVIAAAAPKKDPPPPAPGG